MVVKSDSGKGDTSNYCIRGAEAVLEKNVAVHGVANRREHPSLREIVGADMNPAVRVDAETKLHALDREGLKANRLCLAA